MPLSRLMTPERRMNAETFAEYLMLVPEETNPIDPSDVSDMALDDWLNARNFFWNEEKGKYVNDD